MKPAEISTDLAWRRLHEAATSPYKKAGQFAWRFARGKLGRDPVFRALIERGLIGASRRRVVDIGCGQGLFVSLLSSMADTPADRWPITWARPPHDVHYTGIELMPKDIARAEASVGKLHPRPRFVCADMREAKLPACDLVVILDVLHYVDHAAQEALLRRVRAALQPGGRLLLRIGDADSTRGFAVSQWVDRTVTRIRGHKVSPTWGRSLDDWSRLLVRLGFADVRSLPMSEGTPFANVLLIADTPSAHAPSASTSPTSPR